MRQGIKPPPFYAVSEAKGQCKAYPIPEHVRCALDDGRMQTEQGLALLDALSGDGGAFWEEYANSFLPQPTSLSLPFTLQPDLLKELQHPELMADALKQQVRWLLSEGAHLLPEILWPHQKLCDLSP